MSEQGVFERFLTALHEAALDARRWPAASALIDECCGVKGNILLTCDGEDDFAVRCAGLFQRGERRKGLEREYFSDYCERDERVLRVRRLPLGTVTHISELLTKEELRSSATYNEWLPRVDGRDSCNVRLKGMHDYAHITWGFGDPVASRGWQSSQVAMVERLLPHLRQFVLVRQSLARVGALDASLGLLYENRRVGVVHLDQSGRILRANDRATEILSGEDGLVDRDGFLRVDVPPEAERLARALASALPGNGGVPSSHTMTVRRSDRPLPRILHFRPCTNGDFDFGGPTPAAVVLMVEPGHAGGIDPCLVGRVLELTPAEAQIAAWLAEGETVKGIAEMTGRKETSVYWHLRQIYAKQSISGQTDLIRLVLSVSEFG